MSYVDKLLERVNSGNVRHKTAIKYLERAILNKDKCLETQKFMLVDRIIQNINPEDTYHISPEEILIKKENYNEKMELIAEIKRLLTPKQLEVFSMFVETQNECETARRLQCSREPVHTLLRRIRHKLSKKLGSKLDMLKESLLPTIHVNLHIKPMSLGQPYEQVMELPIDMKWQGAYGIKQNKKSKVCGIPEYLEQTKSGSVCNICEDKCTRKESFPAMPERSKESLDKFMAIIDANSRGD